MPAAWRLTFRLLLRVASIFFVVMAVPAVPLAVFAATARGRALSCGAIFFALGFFGFIRATRRRHPRTWPRRLTFAMILGGAGLVLWARLSGPGGQGGDGELRIEHFSTIRDSANSLPAAGTWLPEMDLVATGIGLSPLFDPLIDRTQARRIHDLVMPRYQAIANSPAFGDLGSTLGESLLELIAFKVVGNHALAMVPRDPGPAGKPMTTLVFLHGSAGNFAVYWYALAPLAREYRMAMVFPTFGFGNWQQNGGVEAILTAKASACERFGLDRRRVFLAALSNGGRGATRVLTVPGEFLGVALISAVIEEEPLNRVAALGGLHGLPVLFMHGGADNRIPLASAESSVSRMEAGGAVITRRVFREEDHFLLFARLPEVCKELVGWMERSAP